MPLDLKIHFARCDNRNVRIIEMREDEYQRLTMMLSQLGVDVTEEETPSWQTGLETERLREVLDAVCTVQGLQRKEGASFLPAIESLVCKYAELK